MIVIKVRADINANTKPRGDGPLDTGACGERERAVIYGHNPHRHRVVLAATDSPIRNGIMTVECGGHCRTRSAAADAHDPTPHREVGAQRKGNLNEYIAR